MDAEIGTDELRSLLEIESDTAGEDGDATNEDGDATSEDGDATNEDGDATSENGETVRIVDIRSPRAYERGHIPGSENVPLQQLVDDIEQFDGTDRVVTICPHGKSSVQAARLITSYEGFEGRAESYAPGLAEWDGPVETGSDGAATDHGAGDEGPAAPF